MPSAPAFSGILTRRGLAVILAAWTLWGLLWSVESWAQSHFPGRAPLSLRTTLAMQMPLAYLWAVLTPAIIWLGRKLPPFGGRNWPGHAVMHLLIMAVVVFGTGAFYAWTIDLAPGARIDPRPFLQRVTLSFLVWVLSDGLLYWLILVADWAVEHSRRAQERQVRASQLETQLVQARLQALQTQLHPHFLFNALHTIGTLVRTGQDTVAVRVVAGLGDLLRRVLDGAQTTEVPLKQELEFVRGYLDIERVRFPDRLRFTIEADPDTLDAAVPQLLLQPLVENAVRHGVAPRERGGQIIIGARRIADQLCLLVRDDGTGLNGQPDGGVGIANTRQRLHELFGADHTFEVVGAPDGGVEARIAIPFRLATAEWHRPA
jgi:two-component system LytT family sensor kinase